VINDQITGYDQSHQLVLIMDMSKVGKLTQLYQKIGETQTYTDNPAVKWLLVYTKSKFHRLVMVLAFTLTKPRLRLFDNWEQIQAFLNDLKTRHYH
jgi:hypothetical protein